jgi:hypothetical protein
MTYIISFFYKFIDILKVICKNSEKTDKKRSKTCNICYKCNNIIKNKDIIYYGFDKTFCSEDCREYYIDDMYDNII